MSTWQLMADTHVWKLLRGVERSETDSAQFVVVMVHLASMTECCCGPVMV